MPSNHASSSSSKSKSKRTRRESLTNQLISTREEPPAELFDHGRSISEELAAHPNISASKAARRLYPKPFFLKRLLLRFTIKHELSSWNEAPPDEEELERAFQRGNWGKRIQKTKRWEGDNQVEDEEEVINRPTDLFLKIYSDVLLTLSRDPLAGLVPPALLGSHGTVPLTVISVIPDIMQHYYDCIVLAKREVILATNYWQPSDSVTKISNSLRELSRRVSERKGEKVIVKLMYDRGTPEQLLHNHAFVPPSGWKKVDLPEESEVPNLNMEVINFHRMILGTFHAKFLIVDREVALLNSNNIQDRPNLEMMTHLEGPIVDSFYEMFLLSWSEKLRPSLPCIDTPASSKPTIYKFQDENPYLANIEIAKAAKAARTLLKRQNEKTRDDYEAFLNSTMASSSRPASKIWESLAKVGNDFFPEGEGHGLSGFWHSYTGGPGSVSRPGTGGGNERPKMKTFGDVVAQVMAAGNERLGRVGGTSGHQLGTNEEKKGGTRQTRNDTDDDDDDDVPLRERRSSSGRGGDATLAGSHTDEHEGSSKSKHAGVESDHDHADDDEEHLVPRGEGGEAGTGDTTTVQADDGQAKQSDTETQVQSSGNGSNSEQGSKDEIAKQADNSSLAGGRISGLEKASHAPIEEVEKANGGMTNGKSQTSRIAALTAALNRGALSKTDATVNEDEIEDFRPHVLHKAHKPIPIALVNRKPHGFPGHQDVRVPQAAAWLAAFRYAEKEVFIQTPTLNAKPIVRAIVETCKRNVNVVLYLDLGFNDKGESVPFQGGTNEEVVGRLYKELHAYTKQEYLTVYWYVGKDQTKPLNAVKKQRNCHVKFMTVDGQVGIMGNGNQDSQSWFHSQEINIMIDSKEIVDDWKDAIQSNQNTEKYGRLDKDGIWRGPGGETLEPPEHISCLSAMMAMM